MGLIGEVSGVFDFFRTIYDFLPNAVKILILAAFGGFVLIAILRTVGR